MTMSEQSRAMHAERMRKLHADPAFVKIRCSIDALAKHTRTRMRNIGVNVGAEDAYRLARRKGLDKSESIRIANSSIREQAQ